MRKILLAMIVVCGCGKEVEKAPETPAVAAKEQKPAAVVVEKKSQEVEMLQFDRSAVKIDGIVGQIIGGSRWKDRAGENLLVVSQKISQTEEGALQQIYGYLYRTVEGKQSLLWKIEDRAENWCDEGKGLASEIVVKDIDGDGIAENAFVYNVAGSCDVSPIPYKLMLHSGATKYAIRGESAVNPGDTVMGGAMNLDPAFDSAPAGFREFASDLWRQSVR